jgi:hypothetical protein
MIFKDKIKVYVIFKLWELKFPMQQPDQIKFAFKCFKVKKIE